MFLRDLSSEGLELRKNLGRIVSQPSGGNLNHFGVTRIYQTGNDIFDFTGSNSIDLLDSATYTSLTFCSWIKTSLTSSEQAILDKSFYSATTTTSFPFAFRLTATGALWCALSIGNDYNYDLVVQSVASGLNDNNWHHVGIIYKANTFVKLFIDGTLNINQSHSVTINSFASSRWTIAAPFGYNFAPSINFQGQMKSPIFAPSIDSETLIIDASNIF